MLKKSAFLLISLFFAAALAGCSAQDRAVAGQEASAAPDQTAAAGQSAASASPIQTNSETKNMADSNKPQMVIDQKKNYTAILHTDAGDLEIALNARATPITVNNFVWLAKKNFYDNTIFHRVIKGFMIQGGDPKGDGTGGPGYSFADEPFAGEYERGAIAMANAGPNTNGSQFFIMHAAYPLPKDYVIFGQATKGLEAIDKIAEAPVTISASGEMSKPLAPVKIRSIEIIEK